MTKKSDTTNANSQLLVYGLDEAGKPQGRSVCDNRDRKRLAGRHGFKTRILSALLG